jgi:hypothetical protein
MSSTLYTCSKNKLILPYLATGLMQQRATKVAMPNGQNPSPTTHSIQPTEIQTTEDVIQRAPEGKKSISVEDAIKKFQKIADEQSAQISRDANIRKRNVEIRQASLKGKKLTPPQAEPEVKSPAAATEVPDSKPVTSKPAELEAEPLKSQMPETAPASESTPSNPNAQAQELNKQVEANLDVLAKGLFELYHKAKDTEDEVSKIDFKEEYDTVLQAMKKVLPDLILKKNQENPGEKVLLTFDQMQEAFQNLPENEELKEQTKPKATGKDRWNKLKKIIRPDSSPSQIPGKVSFLHYEDSYDVTRNQNHWIEAWDALHRPSFELHMGDEDYYMQWLVETKIVEWLEEQEKRDTEMINAFNTYKEQGGQAKFWDWKAQSVYTKTSPPPDTISFWDWLEQKNIEIPGVQHLESEPERRIREVKVINGEWKDAFGDPFHSNGSISAGRFLAALRRKMQG